MSAVALSIAKDASAAEHSLQQLMSRPGKSSPILLKDPAAATHPSWHLWLPPHFNSALDLRFMQKQKTRDKEVVHAWKEWVQGGRFQFNEGALIYDQDVSMYATWGETLKAIKFYVLIKASRPVSMKMANDEQTGLRAVQRNPGLVSFEIYATDSSGVAASPEEVSMTQDDFVRYAITGKR
ncbi:MAG: hypothetical protein VKO39_06480 [Cyanobacteriota bacterium]|nr:hypothetical protein [Cyanobacteriota bacterium]